MKNYAGHRLSPWLGHLMVSRQETSRPLLTPGEVMQHLNLEAEDGRIQDLGTRRFGSHLTGQIFSHPRRVVADRHSQPQGIDNLHGGWRIKAEGFP